MDVFPYLWESETSLACSLLPFSLYLPELHKPLPTDIFLYPSNPDPPQFIKGIDKIGEKKEWPKPPLKVEPL